jgi:hypothetical protein
VYDGGYRATEREQLRVLAGDRNPRLRERPTGQTFQLKPQMCLLGGGLAEESTMAEDHVFPLGASHFAGILPVLQEAQK